MGEYKDALIEVSKDCKGYAMEWGFGKCACSKSLQLLQELVMEKELKPKLEQVKKEWEELGYTWKKVGDYHDGTEYTKYIIEKKLTYSCRINLYCQNKTYSTYRYFETTREGYPDYKIYEFDLTIEEHQLLNKTLKALGWFDDENR